MRSVSKVRLEVFYSHAGEDKKMAMEINPCEVSMERGVIEISPKDGYRRYKNTDTVDIRLKGVHNALA